MPRMNQSTKGEGHSYRLRYETLRSLLDRNNRTLLKLSDLEADLNHLRYSSDSVRWSLERLFEETLLMAQEHALLTGKAQTDLYEVLFGIMDETAQVLSDEKIPAERTLIVRLDDDKALEPARTGGKAAGLARMARLVGEDVPPGFVATTAAYRLLLEENGLDEKIRLLLKDQDLLLDSPRQKTLTRTVREWVLQARLPESLGRAIREEAAATPGAGPAGWAVRSSAVFEDAGDTSFAGLFKTELKVPADGLAAAYLDVVASRFLDRAVLYRIQRGIREVDTPMAVLFMPMVEPVASGVVYTIDPTDIGSERMILNAVSGPGAALVQGAAKGATYRLDRSGDTVRIAVSPGPEEGGIQGLSDEQIEKIARKAMQVSQQAGHEMDIEWAVDEENRVRFLQGRRLKLLSPTALKSPRSRKGFPVIEEGVTIFPGRAEGEVFFLSPGDALGNVPKGAVVVVNEPNPEFAPILPRIASLLAVEGSPVGHLATLAREFSVPSLFQIGNGARRLLRGAVVSVNATTRKVFEGSRWPGMRERVLARIAEGGRPPRSGPLFDRILALNLTDPDAPDFKPRGCRSVHDVLRFVHEMSIRSMFTFGDEQKRKWRRKSRKLRTKVPMKFQVVALDRAPEKTGAALDPEEVDSTPFRAFWRGFSDQRLHWPQRWQKEMMGLPREFQETVLGGDRGPRRSSDSNYIMVAADYLNFNARFAYHYSMVDAIVGAGTENNHLFFSFRSGGASDANRARRARFLERVLRQIHFEVDCRGDIVTAWLRRYPQRACEDLLETLGRLMVCARQLDKVLASDASARMYAEYFLQEKYGHFA